MKIDVREDGYFVTLSRRNLLSLLTKLDHPDSACTIYTDEVRIDRNGMVGFLDRSKVLFVTGEPDEKHYANREPPGPMIDFTEEDLRELADGSES